jgi:radical SAM superfamily enzyme YgiQ (UPF0313 family)
MVDEVVKDPVFDAIAVGEAEGLICQMINDAERSTLRSIYKQDRFIDIDNIAIPDRGLIDGTHGGSIFAFGKDFRGHGNENVISSRGCPFKCAFCSSSAIWERKLRLRSPENLLREVRGITEHYGQMQIRFADGSFTTRKLSDLKAICKGLGEMGCVWRCSVRAASLTEEVCDVIVDGGCREVSLGIESGDQRVLDFLNKGTNIEKMMEGCHNAASRGMNVRALVMIGTPGEQLTTPELNRDFILDDAVYCVTLSTYVPLPGSPIWNDPDRFRCSIESQDFESYNRDFWISNGRGGKTAKPPKMLIRNWDLTPSEQMDNVKRMQEYVLKSGKINEG